MPAGQQADGLMEGQACGTMTRDWLAWSDWLAEGGITPVAPERGESGSMHARPGRVTWRVTQIAWRRRVQEIGTSPPPLVDRDLALTRVETPRVWGVPCQHASRRGPPGAASLGVSCRSSADGAADARGPSPDDPPWSSEGRRLVPPTLPVGGRLDAFRHAFVEPPRASISAS
jgi:hypothetical protein